MADCRWLPAAPDGLEGPFMVGDGTTGVVRRVGKGTGCRKRR